MASKKGKLKLGNAQKIVAIIGDEDTVTGFLLTGIGERNIKGETNFLVVGPETKGQLIEDTFRKFIKSDNISVILVTQVIAEKHLRQIINEYNEIEPCILEIPSKEHEHEPAKDIIMQRAHRLLYGSDIQ